MSLAIETSKDKHITSTSKAFLGSFEPQRPQIEDSEPFFSIHKSRAWFLKQVNIYGWQKASTKLQERLAWDLYSQAWEITSMPLPWEDKYEFQDEGSGIKVVHRSDKEEGLDILEVTSKTARRGFEYLQIAAVRQELIDARPKEEPLEKRKTIVWISPKAMEGEDCPHIDTQINVGIVEAGFINLRQFQNRDVDAYSVHKLLSEISKKGELRQKGQNLAGYVEYSPEIIIDETKVRKEEVASSKEYDYLKNPNHTGGYLDSDFILSRAMLTIGVIDGILTNEQVWEAIEGVSGKKIIRSQNLEKLKKEISYASRIKAIKLAQGIQNGLRGEALEDLHAECVGEILGLINRKKEFTPLLKIEYQIDSKGKLAIRTSCGAVRVSKIKGIESLYIPTAADKISDSGGSSNESKFCTACGKENICTKTCFECGGELSSFSRN